MSGPALSVVIPTLDEEAALPAALASALPQADEVVVSDGGSRDATVELAGRAGARVVVGPPGRGAQLVRGAAAAHGEILLFLHADTRIPPGAAEAIRAAIRAGAPGGSFEIRFDAPGWRFRLGETIASRRSRATGIGLGDQAQFVSRRTYDALGGFRPWPLLEDLDFARRLREVGHPAILPLAVTTSARRFVERGPLRTVLANWAIWGLFALGVAPERLARLYRQVR